MRLLANLLTSYLNINTFTRGEQWQIRAGELNVLYFQLIDLDQGAPCYTRYLAGVGVSNQPYGVVVKFPSIDDAQVIQITAVQADPSDSSIWKVTLSSTQIPKSGNVVFMVTEGNVTRTFAVKNALAVEFPGNDGSC